MRFCFSFSLLGFSSTFVTQRYFIHSFIMCLQ